MLSPYIEYAARRSGKTLRLCNNVLSYLLENDKHKAFIFCEDYHIEDLIKQKIFLSEELYEKLKFRVCFERNDAFKDGGKFFERYIVIGQSIFDKNVKFYFDDFEQLNYIYSTILNDFLMNTDVYERLYLTTTPHSSNRMSTYQQGELNNIRTFLKNNNELNILKIGFFGGENAL